MADPEIDVVALTKTYFEVWNSHDEAALRGLHADASSLHDWDATHGPTNAAVAAGVAGIWKAEPTIKCEIIDLYTCGPDLTVVANINVFVSATTSISGSAMAALSMVCPSRQARMAQARSSAPPQRRRCWLIGASIFVTAVGD